MKILIAIGSKDFSKPTLKLGMKVAQAFNAKTTIIDVGEKISEFSISSTGDYRVETSSIKTAKNLNNLENKLSSEISKKIQQKLFYLNNDL